MYSIISFLRPYGESYLGRIEIGQFGHNMCVPNLKNVMNLVPVAPHGLIFGQNEEHRLQEAYLTLQGPFSAQTYPPSQKKSIICLLKSSSNRALKQGVL